MEETKVLCPNCFKAKLETSDNKTAVCPDCGEEFIMTSETSVRFKN